MAMDTSGGAEKTLHPTLALFGGAFNPVHRGHLALASEIEARLGLREILFMPTGAPPHKEAPEISCEERKFMLDLAIRDHPGWRSSDIECRMEGLSYTFRTIAALAIDPPPFFVMGEDAFADFWSWGQPEVILSGTHLLVVTRPGADGRGTREGVFTVLRASGLLDPLAAETVAGVREGLLREAVWGLPFFGTTLRYLRIDAVDVSSTDLRKGLAGKDRDRWADLLPEAVKSYIVKKGIYRGFP
ncbi:MAG: nicotinate (nicotinamide) nucleotide adenylyltransferase [Nitrospirae bacterium]|nr:nicotinate (nicotinamide) nucleotide adenylyltransferase [Nitrospirota bacterium]